MSDDNYKNDKDLDTRSIKSYDTSTYMSNITQFFFYYLDILTMLEFKNTHTNELYWRLWKFLPTTKDSFAKPEFCPNSMTAFYC